MIRDFGFRIARPRAPFIERAAMSGLTVPLFLLALLIGNNSAFAKPPAHAETKVSGAATYALTKQLLAVAPKRFNGSPGHAAAEHFIADHFEPEQRDHRFDVDTFTAMTPAGYQTMHNLIVKFPSINPARRDGIIVLATHYETNYPLKDIPFVGANDGACTAALLIEIGAYFRVHPPAGYSIWLVFDDGEEAVKEWSATDSLYGTRHLAALWSQQGVLPHIKAFLLADMIGDRDLNINPDTQSSPWLVADLRQAAKDTGHTRSVLQHEQVEIEDDHLPFKQRGVSVLDLIDIDYGPHDARHPDGWHHTAEDTIDKISPQSLQISADIFMDMIRQIDQQ
jgi:glutaminyl-peptide cyclotransferase